MFRVFLLLAFCFPSAEATSYNVISDCGGVGDGFTDDTPSLQRCLDKCQPIPGQACSVWLPPGYIFRSQPLTLRSYTKLQVDGTLLSANQEPTWPRIDPLPTYAVSEDAGWKLQYQALLYARDAEQILINGSGTIDGNGEWWWSAFQYNRSLLNAGRPNLLQFVNSSHIEISGVTFRDSPFWCIHPVLCSDIYIHHITIRAKTYAPNSDGIDPDSSRDVLIEHNDIGCGDDHIAIKAGRCGDAHAPIHCKDGPAGFTDGRYETNNVTVRYNVFRNGMGIAIGSEMSGGVRNVRIHHNLIGYGCLAGGACGGKDDSCCGWSPALHVKTTLDRGGYLKDIHFEDNIVYNTSSFIFLETHYQTRNDGMPDGYLPVQVDGISFVNNLAMGNGTGVTFDCSQYDACRNITVKGNRIRHADNNPWTCKYVESFVGEDNYPPGLSECMSNSMHPNALNKLSSILPGR